MGNALQGRVAVITGGTSGIGFATAKLFLQEGAKVVISGSKPQSVARARSELEGLTRAEVSDAAKTDDVLSFISGVAAELGPIDVLFLNAGIAPVASLAETSERMFDEVLAVNLRGPWLALRAAIPHLSAGASVVVNTSIANRKAWPGLGAYAAAKAGLRALVRTATLELATRGIRVNAVSPGPTVTPILEKGGLPRAAVEAAAQQLVSQIPLGRMASAEEIAHAVLFLASSASSFVAGAELVVDGGMSQT